MHTKRRLGLRESYVRVKCFVCNNVPTVGNIAVRLKNTGDELRVAGEFHPLQNDLALTLQCKVIYDARNFGSSV